jgi:nucleotide-binding universal stress UspA family protein
MYKTIMAPNDNSTNARNALMRAAHLAKRYEAELLIARVSTPMLVIQPLVAAADIDTQQKAIDDQLAVDMRELEALARKCRKIGVKFVVTVLLEGPPGPALSEHAEHAKVDLIVMASHSRGELGRIVLGSVTDYLIRNTGIPVFVIKGQSAISKGDETIFSKILVPLDGSDLAERVLPQVAALATDRFTTVNLLQVLSPTTYSQRKIMDAALPWWENEFSSADDYLEHTAGYLRHHGIGVVTDVILATDAAEAIVKHAEEHRADLVALSSSGAGGIKRFVFGSVADQVVRKSPVSVLVFHPSSVSNIALPRTVSAGANACAIT